MRLHTPRLSTILYALLLLLFASTLVYVSCEVESQEQRIQQLEHTLDAVRAYNDSIHSATDSISLGFESEWRGENEYNIN